MLHNVYMTDLLCAYAGSWTKDSLFGHKKDETDKQLQINMQKSKSSTNVGQVFSKKIWKSRSKSQTRPDSPAQPHWTPQVSVTDGIFIGSGTVLICYSLVWCREIAFGNRPLANIYTWRRLIYTNWQMSSGRICSALHWTGSISWILVCRLNYHQVNLHGTFIQVH